jgi:hypothetical protein
MDVKPQLPKELEGATVSLNVAVEFIDIAEKNSSFTPAKTAFSSVSAVLAMIKVGSPRSMLVDC